MERQRRSLKPLNSRKRGAVLIEFAACVIMLLFILVGILEFGWMTRNKLLISNAAREGARTASLGRVRSDVVTRVKNSAKILNLQEGEIVLGYSSDDGANFTSTFPADNTTPEPDQNGVPKGNMIRISINTTNKTLMGTPLFGNRPLNAQVTMVREAS